MTMNLFEDTAPGLSWRQALCPGAVVLRGFALEHQANILLALNGITAQAPFRHMVTPGGFRMSVAMTNCGACGWVSDRAGYRYDALDPDSDQPWPRMPEVFLALAQQAAASAGFQNFAPDACLINRYQPGARLSLHQDKNERDFGQPIVSVSLGFRRPSCSAVPTATTSRCACHWRTAMWWCGAVRRGCAITAFRH